MSDNPRYVFEPEKRPALPVSNSDRLFPIRRIYCVGRNYASHAREMGGDPDREAPFFFSKPADAILPGGGRMPFPLATEELHHEVELVVALGAGGARLEPGSCRELIYGYAVGVDLTRRDLQRDAKASARPWAMAKGFDRSAPCSPLVTAVAVGHPRSGSIGLSVNGEIRQSADLADLVWSPEETLAHLSRLVVLAPGDLVFTGTPAGVGSLSSGDTYLAWIERVGELTGTVLGPEHAGAAI
ncbi:MAG: fumarylacetoacetate hydrolase family protein [Gemmatimonadetes bacterium]|nr:fumarylacetoacetate hydrolase family protein [Gemmatimonadota bacterium]